MPKSARQFEGARVARSNRVDFRAFDHCDQVAEMTRRDGEVTYTQLSAGQFSGSTTRLELGDLKVQCTWASGATLNRTRTLDGFVYFYLPVRAGKFVWDGRPVDRPRVIQHDGAHEFVRYGRDLEAAVVAAPRERFIRAAAALAGVSDAPVQLPMGILEGTSGGTRRLTDVVGEVARAARAPLDADESYLEALRLRFEHSVVELLAEQVGVRGERRVSAGTRLEVFERALGHLEERGSSRVTIADLCRAAGVSIRTLEYAFREVCGVSPRQYLVAHRLRAAQRSLREAEPERGAIKRAALDAGFRELGRFSVTYRRFFGESPTETLTSRRRRP